ncbi:endonuclease [Aureibacter tunicatorum]|uniref:Endonuclease I/exonuclease III n=1 Tax=Aureibacter tunicatorum TaxID=866807 RepID=A0AAE3XS47_9BACT|nr:endonuclease [Aureibacter tunicatorum]MDR6241612.1 endonuclease I/exonuclease III [Aureibacter tunicatorum]BDD07165.1 hypothetical protein AUTU_46480 [Aureibacter tunicatorum]
MKLLNKLFFITALLCLMQSSLQAQILITQYYEGSSTNKWIELTNVGNDSIDLSQYQIALWAIGGSSGSINITGSPSNKKALAGILGANSSILLGKNNNGSEVPYIGADFFDASNVINFNGNDGIALLDLNNNILDMALNGINAKDKSYGRATSVNSQNPIFDSSEWVEYSRTDVQNAASDDPAYLGYFSSTSSNDSTDNSPPIWTNNTPSLATTNQNSAQISLSINEAGTIFYLIQAQNEVAPEISDLTANGETILISNAITLSIDSLQANANYTAYFIAKDDENQPNQQSTIASVNFFTADTTQNTGYDYIMPTLNTNTGRIIVAKTPKEYVVDATKHMVSVGFDINSNKYIDLESFYQSAVGTNGSTLKNAVKNIASKDHSLQNYSTVWSICEEGDEHPKNSSQVWQIYVEEGISKSAHVSGSTGWNREHVWAKSHGGFDTSVGRGTDAHHLRASDAQENSNRGSLDFAESNSGYTPPKSSKGDVARAIFYMALRYDMVVDNQVIGHSNGSARHGKLDDLLAWHNEDPVDPYEIRRNNVVYKYQNNRNPFIDHPELVEHIFGNKSTQNWDGGVTYDVPADSTIDTGNDSSEVVILYQESFDNELDWIFYNELGKNTWQKRDYQGNHYIQMSAYQGDSIEIDWAITPSINLDSTDAKLTFNSAWAYNGDDSLEVFITNNFDSLNPSSSNWTKLEAVIANDNLSAQHGWHASNEIDLSYYTGDVNFAFKYSGGTGNGSRTFRVDDVLIQGEKKEMDGSDGGDNSNRSVIYSEDFNNSHYWEFYSSAGKNTWLDKTYQDTKYIQMSAYKGDINETDWAISPSINLSYFSEIKTKFASAWAYDGDDILEMLISTDYNGNPDSANWQKIDVQFANELTQTQHEWINSGEIDLSNYDGSINVAFRYTGGTENLTRTFRIDDFEISGIASDDKPTTTLSATELFFENETDINSYILEVANIHNSLNIIANGSFQLSLDSLTWQDSLTITPVNKTINPTEIFVRLASGETLSYGTFSLINHTENGNSLAEVKLSSILSTAKTLDLVTWNVEWLGAPEKSKSASTVDQQMKEVAEAILEVDADIYALQEVVITADKNYLDVLVDSLNKNSEYTWASSFNPRHSYDWTAPDPNFPPQKTAFIYRTDVVSNVASKAIFADEFTSKTEHNLVGYTGDPSDFMASGRLPFQITADVNINGNIQTISLINLHFKCCSDGLNRRLADAKYLKSYIDSNLDDKNVVILGDYNSTGYENEIDSWGWYDNNNEDFLRAGGKRLDHISISNELYDEYELLENSYFTQSENISDHDPQIVRLLFPGVEAPVDSIIFEALPNAIYGDSSIILNAVHSNGDSIFYESSDSTIVNIEGNIVEILSAGTVDIIASSINDSAYPTRRTLTINKKELVIKVTDATRVVGEDLSNFTIESNGFVYNDQISDLDGVLEFNIIDNKIIASGLSSDNYEITFQPGTLTLLNNANDITFFSYGKREGIINTEAKTVSLEIKETRKIDTTKVAIEISEGASYSILSNTKKAVVINVVSEAGETQEWTVNVSRLTSVKVIAKTLKIFPIPAYNFFKVSCPVFGENTFKYKIYNTRGNVVKQGKAYNREKIGVRKLRCGNYFVEIIYKGNKVTRKIQIR